MPSLPLLPFSPSSFSLLVQMKRPMNPKLSASKKWKRWETKLKSHSATVFFHFLILSHHFSISLFVQTGNGAPRKQQVQIRLHHWQWLGPHSSRWPAWINGCLHAWSAVAQLHAASPWRVAPISRSTRTILTSLMISLQDWPTRSAPLMHLATPATTPTTKIASYRVLVPFTIYRLTRATFVAIAGGHGKSKIKNTNLIVKMDRLPDPPGNFSKFCLTSPRESPPPITPLFGTVPHTCFIISKIPYCVKLTYNPAWSFHCTGLRDAWMEENLKATLHGQATDCNCSNVSHSFSS